ncbi:MAG: IS200/IS605 family transposase [bacterium]
MKVEYKNLYIHYILITKDRYPLIKNEHRARIERYISGIISNHDSKMYAIYANPEHVHFLVSRSPEISDESFISRIAESSEKFINENSFSSGKFLWQQSASAFSVSKGDIDKVCKYILGQAEHHKKKTFQQEYDEFIKFYQQTLKWE